MPTPTSSSSKGSLTSAAAEAYAADAARQLERGGASLHHRQGETSMMKLFYAPHTCSLASHIALENAGAEYTTVDRLRRRRATQAAISRRQPQGPGSGTRDRRRHLDGNAGDSRLYRAELSAGAPGAARPAVRVFASAILQQLFVRDAARRPCSPHARISMGRRCGGNRSHAAQGAGIGGVMLRSHRA
jgi:hypothetical protein